MRQICLISDKGGEFLKRLITSKYLSLLSWMFVLLFASACTQGEANDISSIIDEVENYNFETTQYGDEIKFTLSNNKRLDKNDEPIKIAKIYDTTIYVTEIKERKNNGESDIVVQTELKNEMHPTKGTILSVNRITDNERTITGWISAYDNKGKRPASAGTGHNSETERIHFDTQKKIYMESDKWTFKIKGLNVLKYEKK